MLLSLLQEKRGLSDRRSPLWGRGDISSIFPSPRKLIGMDRIAPLLEIVGAFFMERWDTYCMCTMSSQGAEASHQKEDAPPLG